MFVENPWMRCAESASFIIRKQILTKPLVGPNHALMFAAYAWLSALDASLTRPFKRGVNCERANYYQKTYTYESFSRPESSADDRRVRSVVRPRGVADKAIEECREQQSKQKTATPNNCPRSIWPTAPLALFAGHRPEQI